MADAVLDDGELERAFSGGGRSRSGTGWSRGLGALVKAGVVVAKVLIAEGGGVAPGSVGHDVAAFEVHGWSPLGTPPTPP